MRVPGFRFAGVTCGIKKSKKKDLALIFSERPATVAALFTTNRVKAAPVLVGMRRIRQGSAQAVVINSGNANACTGVRGIRDAEAICRQVAIRLGIDPKLVIPSSTGIIGVPLPVKNVRDGIEKAVALLSPLSFSQAAEAILTTDRFPKVSAVPCLLGGKKVVVAGMAKGAGMLAPRMTCPPSRSASRRATMLAYILTDAAVEQSSLRDILLRSADRTFHSITVDGDTSTNDTILFLANGLAGNRPIVQGSREERTLEQGVSRITKELALKLVEDGEGATKVVEILVEGARSVAEAKKVAFAVANSKLVKTAFFGEDPNLGRIMAAIGYAGVPVEPDRIGVSLDGVKVVRRGVVLNTREREAALVLRRPSFRVGINLDQGKESASVWTSDLSHDYIRINSAYRT
ncbi:MAG: bifunctional glutamate N-acetyltransferase/amino-acid acetyltransferase ArgJ [Candidatus Binatia bacterium]